MMLYQNRRNKSDQRSMSQSHSFKPPTAKHMKPYALAEMQGLTTDWLVDRCFFLLSLRSDMNEFFHGGDVRIGIDFDKQIKKMLERTFQDELEYIERYYPEEFDTAFEIHLGA